jgi:hypothetical protein
MEIYSNKQRLELVKESMEDIILLLEQILSERGA